MEKTIIMEAKGQRRGEGIALQIRARVTYDTDIYPTQKAIVEEFRNHAFDEFKKRYQKEEIKVKIIK